MSEFPESYFKEKDVTLTRKRLEKRAIEIATTVDQLFAELDDLENQRVAKIRQIQALWNEDTNIDYELRKETGDLR